MCVYMHDPGFVCKYVRGVVCCTGKGSPAKIHLHIWARLCSFLYVYVCCMVCGCVRMGASVCLACVCKMYVSVCDVSVNVGHGLNTFGNVGMCKCPTLPVWKSWVAF